MKKYTLGLLLLCLFAVDFDALAQRNTQRRQSRRISTFTSRKKFALIKRYSSIGVSVGASNYFGDIVPSTSVASTDIDFTRLAVGAWATRRIAPHLELRGSFNWIRLRGDDFVSQDPAAGDNSERGRYIRNLHFRNDVKELAFSFSYDLFGNNSTYIRRPVFNPYVHAGVGVFLHNPRAKSPEEFGGKWEALQPLHTEGPDNSYSLVQFSVPLGIGFRYAVANNLDLALEINYRLTLTDYLDDLSKRYPEADALDGDLARAMSFRSAELTAAVSGDDRNLPAILNAAGLVIRTNDPAFTNGNGPDYVATSANTNQGFGPGMIRGNNDGPDLFVVTSLKVRYLIAGRMRAPKFR